MDNLFDYFSTSLKKHPNNYYVFDEKYWTYDEVSQYIKAFRKKLIKKGVQTNNKIVLYMENSIEYIISYFSILSCGATVVPITASSTLENIKDIVDDCKPFAIVTSKTLLPRVDKDNLASKTDIIEVNINEINLQNDNESEIEYPVGVVAMIVYTSGTTNKSKGVMLSHKNLVENTESILDYLKLNNEDSVFVTLPFSYSYGNSLLLTHTKVGGLLYLCKNGTFPQVTLSILEKENFTGFSTVGSYLKTLLKQNNFTSASLGKLNYMTLAGEQTSKSDLMQLQSLYKDLKIYVMYGQTEASARLTYLAPGMLKEKIGSVGKPIKNVTIKVVNENGEEVTSGETGELIAKGDNIMLGYLNKPDETKEILKDGWLYTGDIAYKDADGYIYIVGRKNDIIKYLGHRISPVEIENQINMCENILESAVIDYRDEADNVKIIAFVVLKNNDLGIGDIPKRLKPTLPAYKIPSVFEVIHELPRTSNGKIKRAALKQLMKSQK